MAKEVLNVEQRELGTHAYLKNLRKAGKVPGVYYTHGEAAIPIALDLHTFKKMVYHRINLFDLDFGKGKKKQSIIRELQYDPITDGIIHVDLMGISETEKVIIKVPINVVGIAIGVKEDGGILELPFREVEIECLPKDMPTGIDVDVTELHLNDGIYVRDLQLENMMLVSDEDMLIAHVLPPRVEVEVEEVVEELAEGEEPEVISDKEGDEQEKEEEKEKKE